jgi:lysophospholipase L1-like esterase
MLTQKVQSTSINKIMPLGGSRVEGDYPEYHSFRYEIWKMLLENFWVFDFIGTQSDLSLYPNINNISFDVDHEGRGGWTSGQILQQLEGWILETGIPDIVLFSSPGGNDALENLPYLETTKNIYAIIELLQSFNPNITILLEQMAPAHSNIMDEDLSNYLSDLHEDMFWAANEYSTYSSQVIVVDMYTGFSDSMLADDVHYNSSGAFFIAERYYQVLETVLQ